MIFPDNIFVTIVVRTAYVVFYTYVVLCVLRMILQYQLGKILFWVGPKIRHWLEPEFAHRAFIVSLKITYWEPRIFARINKPFWLA